MKFFADYSLLEVSFRQYFYKNLRSFINIYINMKVWKQLAYDDPVKTLIIIEAKAKI